MTAILYPVAANAEQALTAPLGRAEREREAVRVAGEAVVFATDPTGPAFSTLEAAQAAYGATEPWRRLVEQIVTVPGKPLRRAPAEPVNREGRRWPEPQPEPRTVWRLMVSYWRIASAGRPLDTPQARTARKAGLPLTAEALRQMAGQPLRPVEPQRPLDIGLFEIRPPEAPHILMPDE